LELWCIESSSRPRKYCQTNADDARLGLSWKFDSPLVPLGALDGQPLPPVFRQVITQMRAAMALLEQDGQAQSE
jgi:hypothetical protein